MDEQKFKIDADIRRAETLSSEFYTDDRHFSESKNKIFARSWQFLGTTGEIENLKSFTLLEDFLDEPILLTKDGKKINCLSNVCTHRGKILIEDDCKLNGIRCNYHGRRFDLSGKFLWMPEFETVKNFSFEKEDLTKIPFGVWEKFLFVSLYPFAPFETFFAEIREKLVHFAFDNVSSR